MTPLKVWLHNTARGCNQSQLKPLCLAALVPTFTPGVRNEDSSQPWNNNRAWRSSEPPWIRTRASAAKSFLGWNVGWLFWNRSPKWLQTFYAFNFHLSMFCAAVPSSTQSTRIGTMHCGPSGPVFPTVKSTQQFPTAAYSSMPSTTTAKQLKTTSKRSPDGPFEESSTDIKSSKSSNPAMVHTSQRSSNQSSEESITGVKSSVERSFASSELTISDGKIDINTFSVSSQKTSNGLKLIDLILGFVMILKLSDTIKTRTRILFSFLYGRKDRSIGIVPTFRWSGSNSQWWMVVLWKVGQRRWYCKVKVKVMYSFNIQWQTHKIYKKTSDKI